MLKRFFITLIFTLIAFTSCAEAATPPSAKSAAVPAKTSISQAIAAKNAPAIDTKASHAILIDSDTGAVLFEKNADAQMIPSSMSKLMTVYMVFDRLKKGTLKETDSFTVSEKAWRKQGSKMFVHVGSQVTVHDLLRGIIVQSGNDACITIAEGLMGSEEAFADAMNQKAAEIGLKNSHFINSTGWPDPGHLMTARDLSTLARHLIKDFPEYYPIFSEHDFTYNGIRQENRNMLLGRGLGSDGLKTGHTEEAGYGITASAKQGNRRLILVVNGLSGTVERANEGERLLKYGLLNFDNVTVFKKGDTVAEADVWMGKAKTVPLTITEDSIFTLPKTTTDKVKVTLKYKGPVPAPITKGAHIADLAVSAPGIGELSYPLVAANDIEKLSFFGRIGANAKYYLMGGK